MNVQKTREFLEFIESNINEVPLIVIPTKNCICTVKFSMMFTVYIIEISYLKITVNEVN